MSSAFLLNQPMKFGSALGVLGYSPSVYSREWSLGDLLGPIETMNIEAGDLWTIAGMERRKSRMIRGTISC